MTRRFVDRRASRCSSRSFSVKEGLILDVAPYHVPDLARHGSLVPTCDRSEGLEEALIEE